MQFLMAPVWGRLSDRIGRRPVLLFAMAASAGSYVTMGLAPTLAWLFVARGAAGAAGGSVSAAQAYIADITPPKDRAKGMGLIGAAFGLGFIFGPAIGGLLSAHAPAIGAALPGSLGGYILAHPISLPMFFAASLSVLNILAALVRLPESLSPELRKLVARREPRLRALMTALSRPHLRGLVIVFFLASSGFSMMEATFALLMKERLGLSLQAVTQVFVFVGVVAVIIQGGLIGRLSRRFGEWRLLGLGLLSVAIGLVGLTQVTGMNGLLGASAFIAGGNGLSTPSLQSLISKTAAAHEQGGTLGVSQSAGALARIIGPLVGGLVFDFYFGAPYLLGAALLLSALVVTWIVSGQEAEAQAPVAES
jgi:MFS family permease